MEVDFAVSIVGEDETKAYWVLAVDPIGERLLISSVDRELRWVNLKDCRLGKVAGPEQPRAVVIMQPQSLALDPYKLNRRS